MVLIFCPCYPRAAAIFGTVRAGLQNDKRFDRVRRGNSSRKTKRIARAAATILRDHPTPKILMLSSSDETL